MNTLAQILSNKEPAPADIHFDCPKCKRPMSGDRALLGEIINCPDCGETFQPAPRKNNFVPNPDVKPPEKILPAPPDELAAAREKIRHQASSYSAAAVFFLIIGVLAFFFSSFAGCGLIAFAFWLELVAQIIHIRANTLR